MRVTWLSLLAVCLASCGSRTELRGSPGTQGHRPSGTGGKGTNDGPPELDDVPRDLLDPVACASTRQPSFLSRLPQCVGKDEVPCRDSMGRMLLPLDVNVVDMAAHTELASGAAIRNLLFVRTSEFSGAPLHGPWLFDPDLTILGDEPNGVRLLQSDAQGNFYALQKNEQGDFLRRFWLDDDTRSLETPPDDGDRVWNALAVSRLYGSVVWARNDGHVRVFDQLLGTGATRISTAYKTLIGLSADETRAYVATNSSYATQTVQQLSLPDLTELGHIELPLNRFEERGPLLSRSQGAYVLLGSSDPSRDPDTKKLREISAELTLSDTELDISDARRINDDFDEVFFATSGSVERIEHETKGTLSRRVVGQLLADPLRGTRTKQGVHALAYGPPFLYVASRGDLPLGSAENPDHFRIAIETIDISTCAPPPP